MKADDEVIAVNYWREVKKDLKNAVSGYWNALLLVHNSEEFKEIINFIKILPYSGKIVYISLTKTNDVITPYFRELKARVFVVDCVSSIVFEKENTESCFFEESPSNLSEIIRLIDNYLKFNPDLIILDSLSQFVDFSSVSHPDKKQLSGFLDYMKAKKSSTPCRFIILYDNILSKELRYLPAFDIDLILKLEVITGRIYWGD